MLLRIISLIACFFVVSFARAATPDEVLAVQDRAQFPVTDHPFIFYGTTKCSSDASPVETAYGMSSQLTVAMNYIFPQLAPRQPVAERCLPVPVPGSPTLFRFDLRDLGWDMVDANGKLVWNSLIAGYPYSEYPIPLVLRMDWLLLKLTDSQESPAYYTLVYGKVPKTRDEALATFQVNTAKEFQRGVIAGDSPVSVAGTRRIIQFPSNIRVIPFLTEDTIKLEKGSDPLENPNESAKHDGEEAILMVEKIHKGTGTTGYIMVFFLANGQGAIVNRAPTDLVRDYNFTRGLGEIRNGSSCFVCHAGGFNQWNENQFKEYMSSGVELFADAKTTYQLEAFHLIDLNKQLTRANEDYQDLAKLNCGVASTVATACYKAAIENYDKEVDAEKAAYEQGVTLEEFRLALALSSSKNYNLGARISGLAHGKSISRASWEGHYLSVEKVIHEWQVTEEIK